MDKDMILILRNAAPEIQAKNIAEYYGLDNRLNQTMEECAELIQACSKRYRAETDVDKVAARVNLIEEIADVEICIMQLKHLLKVHGETDSWIRAKFTRELDRIEDREPDK